MRPFQRDCCRASGDSGYWTTVQDAIREVSAMILRKLVAVLVCVPALGLSWAVADDIREGAFDAARVDRYLAYCFTGQDGS